MMEKAIDELVSYGLNAEKALYLAHDAKEILIQNQRKATPAQIIEQALRLLSADKNH